jgi:hypothetical protein
MAAARQQGAIQRALCGDERASRAESEHYRGCTPQAAPPGGELDSGEMPPRRGEARQLARARTVVCNRHAHFHRKIEKVRNGIFFDLNSVFLIF